MGDRFDDQDPQVTTGSGPDVESRVCDLADHLSRRSVIDQTVRAEVGEVNARLEGPSERYGWISLDLTCVAPVVRLLGDHDLGTVGEVRELVGAVLVQGEAVILALDQIGFMNGAVADMLLELEREAQQGGGHLEVALPADSAALPRRVLQQLIPSIGAQLCLSVGVEEAQRSVDRWRAARSRAPMTSRGSGCPAVS